MDEPYIGEIRLIGFDFAPRGWALCNGQTLPISPNQALFSLLGTTYGGDGRTTFNLPNLQSRLPFSFGQGPGLSPYNIGQAGGAETVGLSLEQMPAHGHAIRGTMNPDAASDNSSPAGEYPATGTLNQYSPGPQNMAMAAGSLTCTVAPVGANEGHENRQPYIAMNYAIALQGYFPPRS